MDSTLQSLDWSLLKAFLAVAEAGSLSAAARRLSQSQPTLGRQIKQLESALGLTLFERHTRGFALTEAGADLIAHARAMEAAAAQITMTAAGRDVSLSGTVRIAASEVMARHILPSLIADLRRAEPEIQIELVPSDASENLLFREADLAVRMYRSPQLDIITKHVVDTPLGAFAARRYLEQRGTPQTLEDLLEHDIVGYDRDDRIIQAMRAMGWTATPAIRWSSRCWPISRLSPCPSGWPRPKRCAAPRESGASGTLLRPVCAHAFLTLPPHPARALATLDRSGRML